MQIKIFQEINISDKVGFTFIFNFAIKGGSSHNASAGLVNIKHMIHKFCYRTDTLIYS